jgi:hypothetical protein
MTDHPSWPLPLPKVIELVGPEGYIHGWIKVGKQDVHAAIDKMNVGTKSKKTMHDAVNSMNDSDFASAAKSASKATKTKDAAASHVAMTAWHKSSPDPVFSQDIKSRWVGVGTRRNASGGAVARAVNAHYSAKTRRYRKALAVEDARIQKSKG